MNTETWTHKFVATRPLPNRVDEIITITAGLHYIPGNKRPHFSVTGTLLEKKYPSRWIAAGCIHKDILAAWPELTPVVEMHLCDDDGSPMHAEANGWYWLAGWYGGLGEQFHGGNCLTQHWKPDGSFDGYRESTREECLITFAKHCLISVEKAKRMADWLALAENPRTAWRHEIESLRPMWARKASEAIHILDKLGGCP